MKTQDQPAEGPLYDNNPKPRCLTVGTNLPPTVFKFCGVSESAGGLSDTHSGSPCVVGCALPPMWTYGPWVNECLDAGLPVSLPCKTGTGTQELDLEVQEGCLCLSVSWLFKFNFEHGEVGQS